MRTNELLSGASSTTDQHHFHGSGGNPVDATRKNDYSVPMPNLHATIRQLVDALVQQVIKAIRSASFKELQEGGAPHRKARTAQSRSPSGKGSRKVGRSPVTVATTHAAPAHHAAPSLRAAVIRKEGVNLDRLVYFARKAPGIRAEDLRARLGLEKEAFEALAERAITENLVDCERRAMTYTAK